ncbi:MAG: response regulator, partial [Candidatus Electrothrix sp. AR3]|nr:response regulator [Candidatus Electrothrix sp. AR3]
MYEILVVDDDLFTLALLEEKLKSYGDFFTPVYASNAKEAVDILGQIEISLLVTDLVMPGDLNGWHLVEYIESFHPHIPVIVITGCTDDEKIAPLHNKVRKILRKPVRVNQLAKVVISILNEDITSGSLKGFSVASFLQLLEIDEKTCLLEVSNSSENKGLLYINNGKLYDAEYGDLKEAEAACRLLALDNASLKIKPLPKLEVRRRITTELINIIMKAKEIKKGTNKESGEENSIPPFRKAVRQILINKPHNIKKQKAEAIISQQKKLSTTPLDPMQMKVKNIADTIVHEEVKPIISQQRANTEKV